MCDTLQFSRQPSSEVNVLIDLSEDRRSGRDVERSGDVLGSGIAA
jgi:hypothetical protein